MNATLIFSIFTLLPWISAVIIWMFLKNKSGIVLWFSILSNLVLFFTIGLFIVQSETIFKLQLNWFQIGSKVVNASFYVDAKSKAMLCLVGLVSLMVQIFSKSYMRFDEHINRYYLFLQLFVGSMIGLLVADQLWMFYGFWELVGACSFFIISFWHQKESAIRAAKKAFLLNRIGDLALLLGLFMLANHFQTDTFSAMKIAEFGPISLLLGAILVLGAAGKSAQFPLMSWLPDAMEGPTPASALIHAATMVTAGVFLAMKIYPIGGEETHLAFGIIGGISFLSGAIFALRQNDIKKTLAYSTISQIGLMWMGLGSDASLFHLLTHGIFKAGLFLTAGTIIHYLHQQDKNHEIDAQSVQQMGGLYTKIPIIGIIYAFFSLGLIGLPLTNGFYSKENIAGFLISQSTDSAYQYIYLLLLGILAIGITLTTIYISRQVLQIFAGEQRSAIVLKKNRIDWLQLSPLLFLATLSTWLFITANPLQIRGSIFLDKFAIQAIEPPHLWLYVSIALWVVGFGFAFKTKEKFTEGNYQFLSDFWPNFNKTGIGFANVVQQKFDQSIDHLIHFITKIQVILAHGIAWFDRWLVDGLLVKGSVKISYIWGKFFNGWQSGKVQSYWAWVVITFGLFLLYYLL